jgi:uncharacterized protein YceK
MKQRILLLLVVILSGCSTYSTQISTSQEFAKSVYTKKESIPLVYGGTRMDAELVKQIVTMETKSDTAGAAQAQFFMSIYVLIDMPISLVLDTVLLPWSIYKASNKTQEEEQVDTAIFRAF